jgi:serine/threonine-protein kinase HipA
MRTKRRPSAGDFRSVLTYRAITPSDAFVSLTMPVRTKSLKGTFCKCSKSNSARRSRAAPWRCFPSSEKHDRPHSGRRYGAKLDEPTQPVEVAKLLQGDNSEEAFAELVRQHAASGVSGVVPKFLDTQSEDVGRGAVHKKTTLLTRRGGSSNMGTVFAF